MKVAVLEGHTVHELLERVTTQYGREAIVHSVSQTAEGLLEMKVLIGCDLMLPKLRDVLADTREALWKTALQARDACNKPQQLKLTTFDH